MKGKTHDLNHDLTFSALTINCVCHSIRSMFRVLGIYKWPKVKKMLPEGDHDPRELFKYNCDRQAKEESELQGSHLNPKPRTNKQIFLALRNSLKIHFVMGDPV